MKNKFTRALFRIKKNSHIFLYYYYISLSLARSISTFISTIDVCKNATVYNFFPFIVLLKSKRIKNI
uniref:Uncharacterized protein n=1 Tax=Lutzomyia longipalpis TaxID=7200 RepID=A0A7G3B402_LUTLO